jgi:hypothetical protein
MESRKPAARSVSFSLALIEMLQFSLHDLTDQNAEVSRALNRGRLAFGRACPAPKAS